MGNEISLSETVDDGGESIPPLFERIRHTVEYRIRNDLNTFLSPGQSNKNTYLVIVHYWFLNDSTKVRKKRNQTFGRIPRQK